MEAGCVIKMQEDLKLEPLENRRQKQRLLFMYNVEGGLVPAILTDDFLTKSHHSRKIRGKTFEVPENNILRYKNSLFVKTIVDWKKLSEAVICATIIEEFIAALGRMQ